MRRACAWCGKEIDETPCPDADDVSHGICRSCADNLFFQRGVKLEEYLDTIPIPIVACDADCVVLAANSQAREHLKKDAERVIGFKGGVVFECAYSRLPGGCGNTVHCGGCTIRNSVSQTHASGESIIRRPAFLKRHSLKHPQTVRYLISTVKRADIVLLKIEEVE